MRPAGLVGLELVALNQNTGGRAGGGGNKDAEILFGSEEGGHDEGRAHQWDDTGWRCGDTVREARLRWFRRAEEAKRNILVEGC